MKVGLVGWLQLFPTVLDSFPVCYRVLLRYIRYTLSSNEPDVS